MSLQSIAGVLDWMAEAWTIEEKRPRALFMTGGVEVLLGLMVYIYRPPQGIFLNHTAGYHVALICATVWGVVPILAGIWFSLTDEPRPRAAVALLIITVFPLLLVIALAFGGFLGATPPK